MIVAPPRRVRGRRSVATARTTPATPSAARDRDGVDGLPLPGSDRGCPMSATTVEILPRLSRMPTCGELRARLGSGVIVARDPRTRERRVCSDDETFHRPDVYELEQDDERLVSWWVGRAPDEADLDALADFGADRRTLAAWTAAGFSLHVTAEVDPAWRLVARTLGELLDALVVVDVGRLDLVGLRPGLYTPEELGGPPHHTSS